MHHIFLLDCRFQSETSFILILKYVPHMGPIIPVSARDQSVESFKAFPIHLSKVCIDKKKLFGSWSLFLIVLQQWEKHYFLANSCRQEVDIPLHAAKKLVFFCIFPVLRSLDKGASDLKSRGSCSLSSLVLINTKHNSRYVVVDRTGIWPIGRKCGDGQISDWPMPPSFFSRQRTFLCEEVNFIQWDQVRFPLLFGYSHF